jgi:N-acetylneuraminic acid mutarotase
MTTWLTTRLALAIGVLAFAGCHENTDPGQPEDATTTQPFLAVASNHWTKKAAMPTPRNDLVAGVVNNSLGKPILYAIGGNNLAASLGRVEAYNIATNTWTRKASLPLPLSSSNGAQRIGGKLYVAGGELYSPDDELNIYPNLYVYNSTTNSWTRKADMSIPMSRGVSGVIDGKLYVLGGLCEYPCTYSTRRLLRYDPVTDAWNATLPSCPDDHIGGSSGVIDGKFYVTGGGHPDGTFTSKLHVYDPTTNKWSIRAPMPTTRYGAAAAVLGGRLYIMGGQLRSGGDLATVEAYDPVTNRWSTKVPMPTPRAQLAAARVVLNGKPYILAVGGSMTSANEAYAP